MKTPLKDSDKMSSWDVQMQTPNIITTTSSQNRGQHLPKLLLYFTLFISATYFLYTLKLVSHPHPCINATDDDGSAFTSTTTRHLSTSNLQRPTTNNLTSSTSNLNSTTTLLKLPSQSPPPPPPLPSPTNISHIVFGIGASSTLWEQRKNYIKIWYKPKSGMRGVVWLDQPVKTEPNDRNLPPTRISGGTDQFPYTNKQGQRSALRISRIVSETLRLGLKNVRWFVLGDDDTVFVPENLVRVLSKYDHNQYYYIGSSSESHLQNIYFSYAMAYGGGGFAISYPLAVALERMQDRCIHRYPGLYGSDDRIQACMAELGVPLTKELGFHQYDVYGNLFGLLAAHPVTPFVSLHHLDIVEPIFPDVTQVEALQRLQVPMRMDSAGLMQQSICYDRVNKWTISVSWGFAVQVIRGILSPREMEMPTRTFLNWYKRADYTAYAFNTRPVARNPCQKPFVFYLSKAGVVPGKNKTLSEYTRHRVPQPLCKWKLPDPSVLQNVLVFKSPDPRLWDKSPRRNCCRVMTSRKKENMVIDVGQCKTGEVTEI